MDQANSFTRRRMLQRTATGAATSTIACGLLGTAWAAPAGRRSGVVALPGAAQIRSDYERMLRFGNRLPGTVSHERFVTFLEEEFAQAGLELPRCGDYALTRWEATRVGLEVLDGPDPGPVRVATAYVRSRETGPQGVEGPLVHGGTLPALSGSATDMAAWQAAIARYPQDLASWAEALPGLVGSLEGSILVLDLPAPAPLTAGVFLGLSTYRHWPGHSDAEWSVADYKRSWLGPWPGLEPFAGLGAKAVVLIVDGSYEQFRGNFSPHTGGFQPIPGLVVDRDAGRSLRAKAGARPTSRLTLVAPEEKSVVRSVTAVLPGKSDETIIINTHTDGQNVFEENGAMCLLQLARHFASLPPGERLERTLVVGLWPSHMTDETPQAEGWIAANRELVERAAAAVTIEHLGCPEWVDTVDRGYRPTGFPESYGISVTQGPLHDLARDGVIKWDLHRHGLLRAPGSTVGAPFHIYGIPHAGGIAGPTYLLVVSEDGEIEKLDAELASRQTAFYADLVRGIDGVSREALRSADPTLGLRHPWPAMSPVPDEDPSTPVDCGPAERFVVDAGRGSRIVVRFYGRRRRHRGVLVTVGALGRDLEGLTVELRRGRTLFARSRRVRVGETMRDIVLRRRSGKPFPLGRYSLVVRRRGKVLARCAVRLGQDQ